jgi:hypothetical protein
MRAVVRGLKKYGAEQSKETLRQVRGDRALDPHLFGHENPLGGQTPRNSTKGKLSPAQAARIRAKAKRLLGK